MNLARRATTLVFSTLLFFGCGVAEPSAKPNAGLEALDPPKPSVDVTDIDGNVYKTVQIGRQVWMAENLRTTRYRNGDEIPYGRAHEVWSTEKKGMRCTYNHDDALAVRYGQLYNFAAVRDGRGLCPSGWHVPRDKEWSELECALGLSSEDAVEMAIRGIHGAAMKSEAWDGTNSSGFSGLPGGFRDDYTGHFVYEGDLGGWWSSSAAVNNGAWLRYLSYANNGVSHSSYYRRDGFSVRCVRDE